MSFLQSFQIKLVLKFISNICILSCINGSFLLQKEHMVVSPEILEEMTEDITEEDPLAIVETVLYDEEIAENQ